MDQSSFKKLIDQAQSDPSFFHSLVFDPEKVLSQLDFLDRRQKGMLVALNSAEVVAKLVGVVYACGNTCTSSCDNTCGGSCGYTTNIQGRPEDALVSYFARGTGDIEYCGNTCTSSCDNTCGGSCGYTTNLQDRFGFPEFR